MSLGRIITRIRHEKGLRQADLAEALGVHQSYVARWERGQMRPREQMLEKLAEILEVPLEELQATDQKLGSRLLEEKEPELVELFRQAHRLESHELEALKTLLRSMLTRADLEDALTNALARSNPGTGPAHSSPRISRGSKQRLVPQ